MPEIHATAPAGSAVQSPRIFTIFRGLIDTAESAGIPPAELRAACAALGGLERSASELEKSLERLANAHWALSAAQFGTADGLEHAAAIARREMAAVGLVLDDVQQRISSIGMRIGAFDEEEGEA